MSEYCTVQDVKNLTGQEGEDFQKLDPGAFDKLVEAWIEQCSGLINSRCGRTFDIEEADVDLAMTLVSICSRMVRNHMIVGLQSRTAPIVKIDDFSIQVNPASVIDAAIAEDISFLPHRARVSGVVIKGDGND